MRDRFVLIACSMTAHAFHGFARGLVTIADHLWIVATDTAVKLDNERRQEQQVRVEPPLSGNAKDIN